MTAGLLPQPKARFFDNSGAPLSGGLVYTYVAGTTTPLASYTDSTGNTANANPVVLDGSGYANIWLIGTYKIVLKDSSGVQIFSVDNISSLAPGSNYYIDTGGANSYIINPNPAATSYQAGQQYTVLIGNTNTGASTINVSSLGAKSITYNNGTALTAGALTAGAVVTIVYDGTQFRVTNVVNQTAVAITGGTISGVTITSSTIDSSIIGGTTPAQGNFNSAVAPALNVTCSSGAALSAQFTETTANGVSIKMTGNGPTTASKYLRAVNGFFLIANNALTTIFGLSDAGDIVNIRSVNINSATGATNAGDINVAGAVRVNGTAIPTIEPVKAWVKFSISGGVCTVTAQSNVASVTYNAVGTYTVNFTTAMTDANYCISGMVSSTTSNTWNIDTATAPTTTACKMNLRTINSTLVDPTNNTAVLTFVGN